MFEVISGMNRTRVICFFHRLGSVSCRCLSDRLYGRSRLFLAWIYDPRSLCSSSLGWLTCYSRSSGRYSTSLHCLSSRCSRRYLESTLGYGGNPCNSPWNTQSRHVGIPCIFQKGELSHEHQTIPLNSSQAYPYTSEQTLKQIPASKIS